MAAMQRRFLPAFALVPKVRLVHHQSKPPNQTMKIKRVEHVGIAVTDFPGMIELFRDALGLNLEYIEELQDSQTRLAMLPAGETYIELLEGMSAQANTSKWIAEKGPGLYHICFEVDDIDAAIAELKAKGVKLRNETPMIGHANARICFLDPAGTGNVLIELAELPAAA